MSVSYLPAGGNGVGGGPHRFGSEALTIQLPSPRTGISVPLDCLSVGTLGIVETFVVANRLKSPTLRKIDDEMHIKPTFMRR